MRMIRKQLYIAPEQQRKLHDLAARWNCTEAEVMRAALDRLSVEAPPHPVPGRRGNVNGPVHRGRSGVEDEIDRRLAEAGLLWTPPPDPELSRCSKSS